MAKKVNEINPPQIMRLPQPDNESLYIVSVDLRVNLFGGKPQSGWETETIEYHLGGDLGAKKMIDASGFVSLSGVSNQHKSIWAGWEVSNPTVLYDPNLRIYKLQADVKVRDTDGVLNSVAFLAHIRVKDPILD